MRALFTMLLLTGMVMGQSQHKHENWEVIRPKPVVHRNWAARHKVALAVTGILVAVVVYRLKHMNQGQCLIGGEYGSGTPWPGPGFVNGCPPGQTRK